MCDDGDWGDVLEDVIPESPAGCLILIIIVIVVIAISYFA